MDLNSIKDVFDSVEGRRLIIFLLSAAPLSSVELKDFYRLSLDIFNPTKTRKRPFPDVSNIDLSSINNKEFQDFSRLFENHMDESCKQEFFTNTALYSADRILKKAIESGLVIEVKDFSKKNEPSYYFLNSDISFSLYYNGLNVHPRQDVFLKMIKHRRAIKSRTVSPKKESINERVSLSYDPIEWHERDYLFPISPFLRFLWWFQNHTELMAATIERYNGLLKTQRNGLVFTRKDLPEGWYGQSHLMDKAIKDNIFVQKQFSDVIKPVDPIEHLALGYIEFSFNPSYEQLKCFSNFDRHLSKLGEKSPTELLNDLVQEDYKIDPSKRPILFTSIQYSRFFKEQITFEKKISTKTSSVMELVPNDMIGPYAWMFDHELKKFAEGLRLNSFIFGEWYPELFESD